METIRLTTEVRADGTVRIEAPSTLPPGPAEAVVMLSPVTRQNRPTLHWRNLRGLGKEIWEGVDAQKHVDGLRDEWE